jgi:hypothetical protein
MQAVPAAVFELQAAMAQLLKGDRFVLSGDRAALGPPRWSSLAKLVRFRWIGGKDLTGDPWR